MSEEKIPVNKTSYTVMIVMIILLIIGIIVRWDYISQEVSGSFRNLFSPREQPVSTQTDTTSTTAIDTTQSPASVE